MTIIFLLMQFVANAQEQKKYLFPLKMDQYLSGTFAEFRTDHLHSGVDFSTLGKEGLELVAIDDGFVSRIRISAGGYGKAVYIDHPGGITSVYAHLNEFSVVLEDYVTAMQYAGESFEIDLKPEPGLFPVKKGAIIGYSGNTGTSTGPHLHFEIRNTRTEKVLNPRYFLNLKNDITFPVINQLSVRPLDAGGMVNGKKGRSEMKVEKKSNGKYFLQDTLKITSPVIFSLYTYDPSDRGGISGLWSLEMILDSMKVFRWQMDSFAFSETRYLNALIDYGLYIENGKRFASAYIPPGNRLDVFTVRNGNGVVFPTAGKASQLIFRASDFSGNVSELNFTVISQQGEEAGTFVQNGKLIHYGLNYILEEENIRAEFNSKTFYDSLVFEYSQRKTQATPWSVMHRLHSETVPVHEAFRLQIKPQQTVPDSLKMYALIARYSKGKFFTYRSVWEGEFLSANVNRLGDYCIVTDQKAPELQFQNLHANKKIHPGEIIYISISDDLSGIAGYRVTVDDKWILASYDLKKKRLEVKADGKIKPGTRLIRVEVKDIAGNTTIREMKFQMGE